MQDDDSLWDSDDSDRTIIKPVPGGRRRAAPQPAHRQPTFVPPAGIASLEQPEGGGRNPLIEAASTVFALVKRLRDTPHYDDVPRLHASVVETIRTFEASLTNQGIGYGAEAAKRT